MVEHTLIREVLPRYSSTEGHPDYVTGGGEKRLTVVRVRRRGKGPCWVSASWLTWVILKWQTWKNTEEKSVMYACGTYNKSSCRMQDVDVSLVTYCPRQSPWHPTSVRRPFAPGSRKRHIIKPWDQFQRFTHWWFGVAHVQGWLEGESFSIQLSFRAIEENLADIMIQHVLLCSRW